MSRCAWTFVLAKVSLRSGFSHGKESDLLRSAVAAQAIFVVVTHRNLVIKSAYNNMSWGPIAEFPERALFLLFGGQRRVKMVCNW